MADSLSDKRSPSDPRILRLTASDFRLLNEHQKFAAYKAALNASAPSATQASPDGYAVVMQDGHFVGIWRQEETAKAIVNRSPSAKGERIEPMVFLKNAAAQASANGLSAPNAAASDSVADAVLPAPAAPATQPCKEWCGKPHCIPPNFCFHAKETDPDPTNWPASSIAPSNDANRLDWLEENYTLHKSVEILYVVDGYEVTLMDEDGITRLSPAFHGPDLRGAIDAAVSATQTSDEAACMEACRRIECVKANRCLERGAKK